MGNKIKLVQKPIISHELLRIGEEVTKRIQELNLDKLVATDDNFKSLKKLRAELNKEFSDYEDQRKILKKAIALPYQEFEEVYKQEISEKYKPAIDTLKTRIGDVENKLKENKLKDLQRYFDELCLSHEIDFLVFTDTGIEINLTTTLKSYKTKINNFVERVAGDIQIVTSLEDAEEMLAEYKTVLDAGKAINTVRGRKAAIKAEKERARIKAERRKCDKLLLIGMIYDEELKVFVFSDDIHISMESVVNMTKDDFDKKWIELDEQIKAKKTQEESKDSAQVIKKPETAQTSEPIQPPKELKKEEIELVKAKFEVEGTYPQLKALGEYMRKNNIKYKNL